MSEPPDNPEIRERDAAYIKTARERMGLTQGELGKRLGIIRVSVNRFERGVYPVPRAIKLAVRYLLAEYIREEKRGEKS